MMNFFDVFWLQLIPLHLYPQCLNIMDKDQDHCRLPLSQKLCRQEQVCVVRIVTHEYGQSEMLYVHQIW